MKPVSCYIFVEPLQIDSILQSPDILTSVVSVVDLGDSCYHQGDRLVKKCCEVGNKVLIDPRNIIVFETENKKVHVIRDMDIIAVKV